MNLEHYRPAASIFRPAGGSDGIHSEPPSGVTLEGMLRGDPEVYQIWRIHLDLEAGTWMDYLWRKIAFQ